MTEPSTDRRSGFAGRALAVLGGTAVVAVILAPAPWWRTVAAAIFSARSSRRWSMSCRTIVLFASSGIDIRSRSSCRVNSTDPAPTKHTTGLLFRYGEDTR